MKQYLNITYNSTTKDFGEYIQEGGITISKEIRNQVSVTTLDGTSYDMGIPKYSISVQLLDLYDSDYTTLMSYLPTAYDATVTVSFIDATKGGTAISGQFYVRDISYTGQKVIGTLGLTPVTVITGVSFTLKQKG